MDFVEHDLKALMDHKTKPFAASEIKTLMHQLLSATAHMHARGIMHRDLKTANLLMTNRGMMKVADFGLARQFTPGCDPSAEELTKVVVTLWYRYERTKRGVLLIQKLTVWLCRCQPL